MSLDRFVYFKEPPERDKVLEVAQAYFGEMAVLSQYASNLWVAILPGRPSHPERATKDYWYMPEVDGTQRGIELTLMLKEKYPRLDVSTRTADPITSRIADGLASLLEGVLMGVQDNDDGKFGTTMGRRFGEDYKAQFFKDMEGET